MPILQATKELIPDTSPLSQEEGKRQMRVDVAPIFSTVAQGLQLSTNELINQSVRLFLKSRIRQVRAEIFQVHSRYGVKNVEEMEARYEDGTLEEADSWQDLQRLDHLEYERDHLQGLLEALG